MCAPPYICPLKDEIVQLFEPDVFRTESSVVRPSNHLMAWFWFSRATSKAYPQSPKNTKPPYPGSPVKYRLPAFLARDTQEESRQREEQQEKEGTLTQQAASSPKEEAPEKHAADRQATEKHEKHEAMAGKAKGGRGRPSLPNWFCH